MRLWDFALEFYARKGVAPLCLELQDRAGVDVNILIYAVWLASHDDSDVTETDIERADVIAREWRDEVVRPLRSIRRYLKSHSGPARRDETDRLRSEVKKLELAAERIELETLERDGPKTIQAFRSASPERLRRTIKLVVRHYDVDALENLHALLDGVTFD